MAKRTLENCSLKKAAEKEGIGLPDIVDGYCYGFDSELGETHETCQKCKLNIYVKEQEE